MNNTDLDWNFGGLTDVLHFRKIVMKYLMKRNLWLADEISQILTLILLIRDNQPNMIRTSAVLLQNNLSRWNKFSGRGTQALYYANNWVIHL